uniref:Uncharacterized protein n=1 Tax=Hyaloperonospora arabidopsidis (strain Emoy2) TaxID=559515 RepID=M4BTQ9_HYAAE
MSLHRHWHGFLDYLVERLRCSNQIKEVAQAKHLARRCRGRRHLSFSSSSFTRAAIDSRVVHNWSQQGDKKKKKEFSRPAIRRAAPFLGFTFHKRAASFAIIRKRFRNRKKLSEEEED